MERLKSRWEERAEARGIEQGIEQGRRAMVLRQLERRCGPLDESLRERIAALPGERLVALADALLDFAGRADLDRWLATHAG